MLLPKIDIFTILWFFPLSVIVCTVAIVLYNIFFHPNRSVPGPLLARATIAVSQRKIYLGTKHKWLYDLHTQYGPVVRFAPNEVSFTDPEIWKDVYGHKATAFIKEPKVYGPDAYGEPPGLLRSDNVRHARQRKLVSHAFSDKALKDQEQLLKGHVKVLVEKLREMSDVKGEANLVDWYNFTTFDIMGDLTFGESLGQLSSSRYNPWVKAIFSHLKIISLRSALRSWPGVSGLLKLLVSTKMEAARQFHVDFSRERVNARMARKTDRPDIWTFVTRHSEIEGKRLALTELHSNGALFMLAGTETTATALSGLTYILLKNPEKLDRLMKEVRHNFSSFEDLTMTRLSQLEFMNGCIEEGLRMYPPLPVGLSRRTPNGGAQICGRWIAGGTTVSCPIYTTNYTPLHWKDPIAFAPERFMSEGQEEYASDRKDAFNPFSFGPRNCLGKNLAYHEMRLILASVLLHFDLELRDQTEDWLDQSVYVMWVKKPLFVKLTPVR